MSTSFQRFHPGDLIEDSHIEQFIEPIENLESGATSYREATNTGNAYKVNFSEDAVVTEYTPGLTINFKASAANTGSATLAVTGPDGDLDDITLVKDGGAPLETGDILPAQVVSVIYTEDTGATNPRFEVVGGLAGKQSISKKGQPDGYAGLDSNGKVPAAQLPPASGGTPAWGDITGSLENQQDLYQEFASRGRSDVMEMRVISGLPYYNYMAMSNAVGYGTFVAHPPSDGTLKSRMRRLGVIATGTTVAGWHSAVETIVIPGYFYALHHFSFADSILVSGARMFVGLTNETSAATNVEPTTLTECIGVAQLSSDNTQFHAVWGNSTGFSQGLGIPFDIDTIYRLEVASTSSGSFTLTLTDLSTGSFATITKSTGPASSTALRFRVWRCSNGSSATSGLETGNLYLESRFV